MREHTLILGQNPNERFPVPQMGGSDFMPADDLEAIAHALISHYPDFSFLEELTVRVVWKKKGGQSQGNSTLGKCTKPSGLMLFYFRADFVIWLAADHVYDYKLTRWQIEAALYHELKHCAYDEDEDTGEKTPALRGHDIEAFNDEISEYGAWKSELKATAKVFLQMELDLSEPAVSPSAQAAVQKFVDETFKDTSIDSITVKTGGKSATVHREPVHS